jgi:hypothetical protein
VGLTHQPRGLLEKLAAGHATPARVAAREVTAHVALAEGPEEGVADSVDGAVPIRVALEPAGMGHLDAAQLEGATGHQPVNVEPLPDSDPFHA